MPLLLGAEAASLTILLENFDEEDPDASDELERAKHWEKGFVAFMKNWTETEMPEWMDLAYMSERSIEDELERTSRGDILTIAVSYCFMLLYITITLGKVRSSGNGWPRNNVCLQRTPCSPTRQSSKR